ncbi:MULTISPECIES: hypothetical protein [unclassified Enterococcus]|uniref:hypothetical protein n=1 Tax=unclassified Enterococcus TaxID=2608891 RepID=UPI0015545A6A|nr:MULTISPECIES: hypothetical protein [unclassified Enterococcus]MBS7576330.1 hypothetical protein [Enterococcus sp. MMGLQ5-2]MBS7583563.1 hypothetical protein [Enterococcus sp. MMGLQ5-1]NPD11425.1 hypothetical protein [Enterococcus sp. MMGLQ5-1]NPD36168.1 hypothetical protein [Enterococcus sp. MMGLQ5-2]
MKIIALDIDQYRVGISTPSYEAVFSSQYSEVTNNNWKFHLLKHVLTDQELTEIQLTEASEVMNWGNKKLTSKRVETYKDFGDVLANLGSLETVNLIRTVISYLARRQRELFDVQDDYNLKCALAIAVSSEKLSELKGLEAQFRGGFSVKINGLQYQIDIEAVTFVPKTFSALLETANPTYFIQEDELSVLDGINYIVDFNDHYLDLNVYDNGELINNTHFSDGLYEFASQVNKKYRSEAERANLQIVEIDNDMIYQLIVNQNSNDQYILSINEKQKVDLSEAIGEVSQQLTKKILSYLNQDSDIHLANLFLIRDLNKGLIIQDILDDFLQQFKLKSKKMNNKDARGAYLFGLLYLGDKQNHSAETIEETSQAVSELNPDSKLATAEAGNDNELGKDSEEKAIDLEAASLRASDDIEVNRDDLSADQSNNEIVLSESDLEVADTNAEESEALIIKAEQSDISVLEADIFEYSENLSTSANVSEGLKSTSEIDAEVDVINTSEIEEVLVKQSEFLNTILFDSDELN